MKSFLLLLFFFAIKIISQAQIGGQHIYSFLNLPNSARVMSLGGRSIATRDDDVTMGYQNPGLINKSMENNLALTWVDYFSDIHYGFAAYSFGVKSLGTASTSIQYISYGTFDRADETGFIDGTFTAGEYSINTAFARPIDSLFSIGVNLKTIISSLESYRSFGMAFDIGASYLSKDKLFEGGVVFRNLGYQFKSFVSGNRESLPFEIQLGISRRLKHVPLRFSFVAHNLQRPDLTWDDPRNPERQVDPLTGDTIVNKISTADKIMRHAIIGGEFNITNGLAIRVGYNYQRRQEMKIASRLGTVGISWGIGIKVYKFSLAYARSAYHLAGSPNQITLSAKLSEFYRRTE